jgi:hypothetical protein
MCFGVCDSMIPHVSACASDLVAAQAVFPLYGRFHGRCALILVHTHTGMAVSQGPIENLNDHLADPSNVNAFNFATKYTPSP